ncbi:MAG: hypothetical protein AAF502_21785 [Bacteroidota bacterium]
MKILIRSILLLLSICIVVMTTNSCQKELLLPEYDIVPSHHDGIQNLDEQGVDCGGSSGVVCPSCSDGIQNQDEIGVDCGGVCGNECPEDTPRFDELVGTGLPFFHTFETEDSHENLPAIEDNSVTVDYAFQDPAGTEEIVTRYNRPEGLVADGFSDFKFEKFSTPIDFSTYHKFELEVYIPSSNNFEGPFTPTAELIFFDSSNPEFWTTWTILTFTVAEADFDSWVTARFDGGPGLAGASIYDQIAVRIGGSNHQTAATFYMRDFIPVTSFVVDGTPRADALAALGLPFFHTFEAINSGYNLMEIENNSAPITYGVGDPAISTDGVGRYDRPAGLVSDGFSDYKFVKFDEPIDFSVYHKFNLDVFVPSGYDFSDPFLPLAEIILFDSTNPQFWTTWTVLSYSLDEADFDRWVTATFDGGTGLAEATIYDQIAIRIGGSNHQNAATFYVKDFVPTD